MSEIPKIARARLERQSAGAGSHPDADQMTAFLERSLGAQEREQVLDHLARCAVCREVVAVTLTSGPEEAARATRPAREFRWFEWQSLRWAAVAATFVIAVSLVFQTYRQSPETYSTDMAQTKSVAAPPAPATTPAEAAKPVEAAPGDEAQLRADASAKEKAPSSSTVAVLRDQEAESVSGPSKLDAVSRAKTGAKTGELAAASGAGGLVAGGRMPVGRMEDTMKVGKEGKAEVGDTSASNVAASPSAPTVAAGSMRGPAMQQQAGALAQQAPAAPPAAREELSRQAAAEPSRAAADQAEPAKVTAQNEIVSVETGEKDADKRARNVAPADGFTESR